MIRNLCFAIAMMASASPVLADDEVARTLDVRDFDKIDISGVFDLNIVVGDDFSARAEGEQEKLARLKVDVEDGVLHLGLEKRKTIWGGNAQNGGLDMTITLPELTRLDISGVVDGDVKNIDTDRFELDLSGVGDVSLQGKCEEFEARVSGVGDLSAKSFECSGVDIKVSGIGDADVFASQRADAVVSGMGDIDIYGAPSDVSKSSSLFADVTVH